VRRWLAVLVLDARSEPGERVFSLQDGGACFSAETCAPERDLYNTQIEDAGVNLLSFVAPGVVVLIADPQ
jgi:hypothetical protein